MYVFVGPVALVNLEFIHSGGDVLEEHNVNILCLSNGLINLAIKIPIYYTPPRKPYQNPAIHFIDLS